MKTPENPQSKNICELIPHAIDPEHPLNDEFWQLVATGGVVLEQDELNELLDAFLVNLERIRANQNQA